jgi:hypothetical protein
LYSYKNHSNEISDLVINNYRPTENEIRKTRVTRNTSNIEEAEVRSLKHLPGHIQQEDGIHLRSEL